MILNIKYTETTRVLFIVLTSFLSMFVAQAYKVVYHSIKERRWAWRYFFTTGGMPSSHSSTMVAMVACLGIIQFWYDKGVGYEFAIAAAFTIVVIYDAMGVRYQAGKHADILNKLMNVESEEVRAEIGYDEKLKVSLGHKPLEVLYGILLGAFIGAIGALFYINVINQ